MSDKYLSRISGAAESYLFNNWSVIPVLGDTAPGREKQAAIPWKNYQNQRASQRTREAWFQHRKRMGGLAIVTGRISSLAILDFDDAVQWELFRTQHPHLCDTRTVRSPNGVHLYFTVPPTVTIKTNKRADAIDLLFEGCYALAPPTTIQGKTYKLEQGGQPHTFTQDEADLITDFVENLCETPAEQPASVSFSREGEPAPPPPISEGELRGLYHSRADYGNRNNALFYAAITARDCGWTEAEVVRVLVMPHVDNQAAGHHEPAASRTKEAIATIQSAFSRPAREVYRDRDPAMSNSVREALFQRKYADIFRVVMGLRLKGIPNGAYVSRNQTLKLLDGIVGRHSIDNAFHAISPDNEPFFETIKSHFPPGTPHAADAAASPAGVNTISTCVEISHAKPDFSNQGRKTHWRRLPSDYELSQILGVEMTWIADPVSLEELRSVKWTRATSYYRFIERAPGYYPSGTLAWRMGVSITTKNRYDKLFPDLQKVASYHETPLHAGNLEQIPENGGEMGGFMLLDENARCYPAERRIAEWLLKTGRKVSLLRQGSNYYYVGSPFQELPNQVVHDVHMSFLLRKDPFYGADTPVMRPHKPAVALTDYPTDAQPQPLFTNDTEPPGKEEQGRQTTAPTRAPPPEDFLTPKRTKQNYVRKFRDRFLEQRANELRERILALDSRPGYWLSIVACRRLLDLYSYGIVWQVLHRVESRHKTGSVDNPAAFMVSVCQSDWKARQLKAYGYV